MNLTNQEKLELFRLISNKISNRRYKIDESILLPIAHKLAEEILAGTTEKKPRPDRGS